MVNSQHIKWHAQELYKLLKQNPKDPVSAELFNAVDGFLHHAQIEVVKAQAPIGVAKYRNLGLTRR
ncbi:MAG: hypothetical protein JSW07_23255 [bacterium]|nr:MAG: hypothetical protein JSW07_23255 [bacterium]